MSSKIAVWSVSLCCLLLMWVISHLYHLLIDAYEQTATLTDIEYSWFFRLLLNFVGYSTVLLPLFILYKYLQKINYFDKITPSGDVTWRVLYSCFGEPGERLPESGKARRDDSAASEGLELAFCFTGLMGAYLVWGLLQEKIMTQNYVMPDGSTVRFADSQFLVFVNRLSALVVAGCRLACSRAALSHAPLLHFSYCALSNVISAWCQYEALKYVSFPTQVLSKSCKVIPVMLMGKLISRNKYELYEYVTAVLISVGMVLFMLGSHDESMVSSSMTVSGVSLLAVYMVSDSFTSSWQGAVFARYSVSALHMVCAVNAFSCALTLSAHAHAAPPLPLLRHAPFAADCLLLSLSSAVGQLLIYRTIARFGAVVFTIIMTLRQAVSILLSCLVYGHSITVGGSLGVLLVFAAVMLRLYCRQRVRRRKPANI